MVMEKLIRKKWWNPVKGSKSRLSFPFTTKRRKGGKKDRQTDRQTDRQKETKKQRKKERKKERQDRKEKKRQERGKKERKGERNAIEKVCLSDRKERTKERSR